MFWRPVSTAVILFSEICKVMQIYRSCNLLQLFRIVSDDYHYWIVYYCWSYAPCDIRRDSISKGVLLAPPPRLYGDYSPGTSNGAIAIPVGYIMVFCEGENVIALMVIVVRVICNSSNAIMAIIIIVAILLLSLLSLWSAFIVSLLLISI